MRALAALGVARDDDRASPRPPGRPPTASRSCVPAGRAPRPSTLHRLLGTPTARATTRGGDVPPPREPPAAARGRDRRRGVDDRSRAHGAARAGAAPEARLVLVGDADQLPAVEAGGVLARSGPGRAPPRRQPPHGSRRSRPARPCSRRPAAIAGGDPRPGHADASRPRPRSRRRASPASIRAPRRSPPAGTSRRVHRALVRDRGRPGGGRRRRRRAPLPAARRRRAGFEPDDDAAVRTLLDHHRRLRLLAVTAPGPNRRRTAQRGARPPFRAKTRDRGPSAGDPSARHARCS